MPATGQPTRQRAPALRVGQQADEFDTQENDQQGGQLRQRQDQLVYELRVTPLAQRVQQVVELVQPPAVRTSSTMYVCSSTEKAILFNATPLIQ